MSKHTKEWLRNGGPYEIWSASGYQIADFHVSAQLSDEECEANARLAGAAPRMLAELHKIAAWLDRLATHSETMAKGNRFETMVDAYTADAKNFRATLKQVTAAITAAEDGT